MKRIVMFTAFIAVLGAVGLAWVLVAPPAEGLPPCPCDTSTLYTTSGSTATGSTCSEARTTLSNTEKAKIFCASNAGHCNPVFVYNNCSWNGSAYQITGWWQYNCRECDDPPEP